MSEDLVQPAMALAQLALLVLGAPLFTGLIQRLAARAAGRQGPPLWLPYRRLRKLLVKEDLRPDRAGPVFELAPVLAFSATLGAAALVPALTGRPILLNAGGTFAFVSLLVLGRLAATLGALDGGGGALAALALARGRATASLAEPALIVALLAFSLGAGSTEPAHLAARAGAQGLALSPSRLLAGLALLAVLLLETAGVSPGSGAGAAAEATTAVYSGRRQALCEATGHLRLLAQAVLVVNLLLPWGMAETFQPQVLLLGLLALAGKALLLAAGLAVAGVRLGRFGTAPSGRLAALAFALALVALLLEGTALESPH